MGTLERGFVPRAMSVIAPADAIVLLGGAMRGDTHMGTLPDLNQHADRLVHAVALYKAGKAPVIRADWRRVQRTRVRRPSRCKMCWRSWASRPSI